MSDLPIKKHSLLPPSIAPRGLCRAQAAEYVGISPSMFDVMIRDGRMPKPKRVGNRTIWDVRKLDSAFDDLPGDEERNPWDDGAS